MSDLLFIHIEDADDPRLSDYRDIRDRDLRGEAGRPGLFIGEQMLTIEKMLSVPGMTRSILIDARWQERIRNAAKGRSQPEPISVYIATSTIMQQVAGFRIHRGALACGYRPPASTLTIDHAIANVPGPLTLLACEDIANIDNIGGLFRNATAFGIHGVVLSPRCHDPLYRKSIRVSIGHVLTMPWARSTDWLPDLERLRTTWNLTLIAAATCSSAVPIDAVTPPQRTMILMGSEYEGISAATLECCDYVVRIPMAAGVDSLNVSTAAAVMMHRFSRGVRV
ncbi:MAG: TrmH family RNA methyltransferase [Phycisphaerales bacterium]